MANKIFSVLYTSNSGADLRTGLDSEIFLQGGVGTPKVGGFLAAASGNEPQLSGTMKPRRALMVSDDGKRREIILLTANAPLATLGSTLQIEDSDGVADTYYNLEVRPESFRRRRRVA